MKAWPILAIILLPLSAAGAQIADTPLDDAPSGDVPLTSSTTSPQNSPDPGRDVAEDPTSLTGRGGKAIHADRTFQETIGTQIYTPIGTSIGTQMGVPH